MSQAAKAMSVYSSDQTAPMNAPDGVQEGLIKVGYQESTERLVKNAPTYAAPKHTNNHRIRTVRAFKIFIPTIQRSEWAIQFALVQTVQSRPMTQDTFFAALFPKGETGPNPRMTGPY